MTKNIRWIFRGKYGLLAFITAGLMFTGVTPAHAWTWPWSKKKSKYQPSYIVQKANKGHDAATKELHKKMKAAEKRREKIKQERLKRFKEQQGQ